MAARMGRRLDVEKSVLKFKTRICLFWLGGNCPYGDRCMYAHGNSELRMDPANDVPGITPDTNPRYRTRLCKHFMNSNGTYCPHGIRCAFAHGLEELAHYTRLADGGVRTHTVVTAESEEIPAAATGIPHLSHAQVAKAVNRAPGAPPPSGPRIRTLVVPAPNPDESHGHTQVHTSGQPSARADPVYSTQVPGAPARNPGTSPTSEAPFHGLSVDTLSSSLAAITLGEAVTGDPDETPTAATSDAVHGAPKADSAGPASTSVATVKEPVVGGKTGVGAASTGVNGDASSVREHPRAVPANDAAATLAARAVLRRLETAALPAHTMEMLRRMNTSELAAFLNQHYGPDDYEEAAGVHDEQAGFSPMPETVSASMRAPAFGGLRRPAPPQRLTSAPAGAFPGPRGPPPHAPRMRAAIPYPPRGSMQQFSYAGMAPMMPPWSGGPAYPDAAMMGEPGMYMAAPHPAAYAMDPSHMYYEAGVSLPRAFMVPAMPAVMMDSAMAYPPRGMFPPSDAAMPPFYPGMPWPAMPGMHAAYVGPDPHSFYDASTGDSSIAPEDAAQGAARLVLEGGEKQ